MIRWMRIVAVGLLLLAFIVVGVAIGLLLVENGSGDKAWVPIELHPWLQEIFGQSREAWLPALVSGWLVATLAIAALLLWSGFYVWRRRQYESLVRRLERELVALRNLPFSEAAAPFEDIPETPDPAAAEIMAAVDRQLEFADPDHPALPPGRES